MARLAGWLGLAAGLLAVAPATAATFVVSTNADGGPGSLRAALEAANASGNASDTITFTLAANQTITLASALPVIDVSTLVIDGPGNGLVIDGGELGGGEGQRVFFVESGSVTIDDLAIENGLAVGGDGAGRGGGGLGAGGALFVGADAEVTIENVGFTGNQALGGDGGDNASAGGGGGGLGGDGGSGSGGGGGFLGDGGDGGNAGGGGGGLLESDAGADGGAVLGGAGGGAEGGAGGTGLDTPGGAGGAGSGGGGAGGEGPSLTGASGGHGGSFGGGGGGSGGFAGGDGGRFGGGGGAGGNGGFGGGGGGGTARVAPGTGGFGAGDGGDGSTGGEGGSAFGGAVFVEAGGSLTLRGAVDFSGNQVARGLGGDAAGDGAQAGQALYLPEDVELGVETDSAASVAGSISGDGSLRKAGTGTLSLLGANNYSGGTRVEAGQLTVTELSMQGAIVNDATVVYDSANDGLYPGVMSGSGAFVKQGASSLTLDGANTYQGGTQVAAGTLQVTTASLPGDAQVDAGARLVFEQATNGSYAGDLSGDGEVEKAGAGILTLTGDNSGFGFAPGSGQLLLLEGTLQGAAASLPGDVVDDATLVFAQPQSDLYEGNVSGTGVVHKRGGGTLTLAGNFTHAGDTIVEAGGLLVEELFGSIQNDVVVQSGALFGGLGPITLGTLFVEGGGTAAPGLSIGTQSVQAVEFQANSNFAVELQPPGPGNVPPKDGDLLAVTGTATIDPTAQVRLDLSGAAVQASESWTILTAANILGNFDPDTLEDLAFLDATVANNPGNTEVVLTLTPNGLGFFDVAATRNQQAVGTVLDTLTTPPAGDLQSVIDDLMGLTTPEVRSALDQISGEGISAFTSARLANSQKFVHTVMSRLGIVGGRAIGSPGTVDLIGSAPQDPQRLVQLAAGGPLGSSAGLLMLAAAGPVSLPPPERQRFGVWLDGYGVFGGVDGDANAASTDWTTGGASGGFDVRLGDHVLLGLAGGYARLDVDVDARRFSGQGNVFQGGLYGAYVGERLYVGVLGRYGYADLESRRQLVFGDEDRTARGDFAGHEAGVYAETGYVAFAPAGVQIEPMAAVSYGWLEREGFHESGADGLNLAVKQESWNSVVGSAGLRVHGRFGLDEAAELFFVPELSARYAYEFGDVERPLDATLGGATSGGSFRVLGASAGRSGGIFGVGWSVNRAQDLSFYLDYELGWNPDLLNNAVAAGLLVRW